MIEVFSYRGAVEACNGFWATAIGFPWLSFGATMCNCNSSCRQSLQSCVLQFWRMLASNVRSSPSSPWPHRHTAPSLRSCSQNTHSKGSLPPSRPRAHSHQLLIYFATRGSLCHVARPCPGTWGYWMPLSSSSRCSCRPAFQSHSCWYPQQMSVRRMQKAVPQASSSRNATNWGFRNGAASTSCALPRLEPNWLLSLSDFWDSFHTLSIPTFRKEWKYNLKTAPHIGWIDSDPAHLAANAPLPNPC